MTDLYLIFKNMLRNKMRFFLNTTAIVIAFLLFGVLGSVKNAFNAGVELSADNRLVVVNKINFTQPMPLSYVAKVRAIDGVKSVTHANWFGAYIRDSKHFFAGFAVDPESYLAVYSDYVNLPEDQQKRWSANRQGVIVGETLAKVYGWQLGDRIPVSSNIYSQADGGQVWDMVVEGIFSSAEAQGDTNFLLFHYKYFIETQTFGSDWVGWLVLNTASPSINDRVANEIDRQFANSSHETETSSEKQFNKAFLEQIGSIGLIVTSVVGAAFFTLLLIVGNSMVLSIRERTKEIAVLKTLGFSSSHIFRLVILESVLLASLGGLLGILVAKVMVTGMSQAPNLKNMLPNLVMDQSIVLTALVYMVSLGIVTGFVPAYRAMQLNIVDGLTRR